MRFGRDTKEYWEARVRPYLGTEDELCAVTTTGLPRSFARFVHWLEKRSLRKALQYLPEKGRLLDVGCGYGRWFHLWGERARPLVGADISMLLVKQAKARHPEALLVVGDVRYLPFRSGIFDTICTVKVLQFLPPEDRGQAMRELLRVTYPGGYVILLEKIKGQDGSLPEEWTLWATQSGGALVTWFGNEYVPLDQVIEALRQAFARWVGRPKSVPVDSASPPAVGSSDLLRLRWAWLYRIYLAVRQVALVVSRLLEPLMERLLPASWAVHGLFVFRKM